MRCRHIFFLYEESLLRIIDNFIGKFKVGMFFVHCKERRQMYMIFIFSPVFIGIFVFEAKLPSFD